MNQWIIEKNYFDEKDQEQIIDCIMNPMTSATRREPDTYLISEYSPIHKYNMIDKNHPVMSLGSIEFIKNIQLYDFKPGTWCNFEDFKCTNYYPQISHDLLNEHHIMMKAEDLNILFDETLSAFNGVMHIRPNASDKPFPGFVTTNRDKWDRYSRLVFPDDLVIVSPFQKIKTEIRCFVTKTRISECSIYKENNEITFRRVKLDSVYDFVFSILPKLNMVDPIFTIDIATTDDVNWKVLELNSFSCSGFYSCAISHIMKHASTALRINDK